MPHMLKIGSNILFAVLRPRSRNTLGSFDRTDFAVLCSISRTTTPKCWLGDDENGPAHACEEALCGRHHESRTTHRAHRGAPRHICPAYVQKTRCLRARLAPFASKTHAASSLPVGTAGGCCMLVRVCPLELSETSTACRTGLEA